MGKGKWWGRFATSPATTTGTHTKDELGHSGAALIAASGVPMAAASKRHRTHKAQCTARAIPRRWQFGAQAGPAPDSYSNYTEGDAVWAPAGRWRAAKNAPVPAPHFSCQHHGELAVKQRQAVILRVCDQAVRLQAAQLPTTRQRLVLRVLVSTLIEASASKRRRLAISNEEQIDV
jgi:hypothetical protein